MALLVLSSFIFTQNAPGDGAFSTFHVKAENPTEYANYLKENSQLLGNQNPVAAGTCITRAGSRYTGEMFVWQAFNSCLLYTSPSPRDRQKARMPSSA